MGINVKASSPGETSTMQRRVDTALDELKVDRIARDAGVRNNPPTNSTTPDANEQGIIVSFTTQLRQRKSDCESRLEQFTLDRRETATKIDIEQTKHSFARLLNAVKPELEKLRQDHSSVLHKAKESEERALRYLRHFQHEHGLYNRGATYPDSLIRHFAIIAAIGVLEWISLSSFYAEGSDFGLLGGILIAMVLSITNVGLLIIAGSLLRYLNHKNLVRKLLAIGGSTFLVGCFILVTLGAAHYRVAANEISQSQQPGSRQSGAATTGGVAVASTDADQWRAAKLAGRRLSEAPVGFEDVFSWVPVVLAVLFGIVAGYKGYHMDDVYPGYGKLERDLKRMRAIYEVRKRDYTRAVDQFFENTLQEQGRLLSDAKSSIAYYNQLAAKTADEIRAFCREAAEISDACNLVVARYRQVNTEVATAARPGYFKDKISFDAALLTPPDGLSAEEEQLRKRYENATREFSDIAQANDSTLQKLRTDDILRREDYFKELERDVQEKLAREAAAMKV